MSEKPQLPTVNEGWIEANLICNVAKPKQNSHMLPPELKVKVDRRKERITKADERTKPIMSPELEGKVMGTIAQFRNTKKWKEWGMQGLRQGAVVLFHGPPGCGKTLIAQHLALCVGHGLHEMNMKLIGGAHPGDAERNLAEGFATAQNGGWKTIFIDECDSVLPDRSTIDSGSQYMIGLVNQMLVSLAAYRGLCILATNRPRVLDPALKRRLLAEIEVPRPQIAERVRLWRQKMPPKFPLQLTTVQVQELSSIPISGAEIENAIILEASDAINKEREPSFATLQKHAESFHSL